jgi:type I restriction enzyme, S subunit
MSFRKYEFYKSSKVDWIGSIPQHWEELKLKYITKCNGDTLNENTNKEYTFKYIDISSINGGHGEISDKLEELSFGKAPSRARRKVQKGDTIISTVRTYLKAIGYIDEKLGNCIASTGFAVLTPKKIHDKFLYYALRNEAFISKVTAYSTGVSYPAINATQLISLKIVTPPTLQEQKQIADFIERKTKEVEKLIDIKKQQIQTLQLYRQSLITETVTKGLDADTPMRDSGVEWIGEIPEHWEVKKLGYLGRLQNGISKPSEEFGHGHPFVSYSDVHKNIELPVNVDGLVNSSKLDRRNYSVEKGDVFFTRTSETIQEIGFTSTCMETIPNATFAGFLIRFRPSKDLEPIFSKYYFRSNIHRKYFVKEMNIVTRASLGQELLRRLPVVIPPTSEQLEIGLYLDDKLSTIYEAINKINIQIELLQNYHQSLIYEAVTGKIDVREMEVEPCLSHPIS